MKQPNWRHRPRFPMRRWYRKNFQQPTAEQESQWIRYVRSENQRRQDLGGDELESREFRVEAQVGWFQTLPRTGATSQQQSRSSEYFIPVIALRSKQLTRRCFRTPVTERGYPSEGMPLRVSLPRRSGVTTAVQWLLRKRNFRVSLRLEKWSDRSNPLSLTRTAYKVVGGTLADLLEMVEEEGILLLELILNYGHYITLNISVIFQLVMVKMEVKTEALVQKVKIFLLKFPWELLSKILMAILYLNL